MQGVGPATASAILTAFDPNFPFMGDEALEVALGLPREYTLKKYLDLAMALRQKAQQLSNTGK